MKLLMIKSHFELKKLYIVNHKKMQKSYTILALFIILEDAPGVFLMELLRSFHLKRKQFKYK